jgi:hypothetical protein
MPTWIAVAVGLGGGGEGEHGLRVGDGGVALVDEEAGGVLEAEGGLGDGEVAELHVGLERAGAAAADHDRASTTWHSSTTAISVGPPPMPVPITVTRRPLVRRCR